MKLVGVREAQARLSGLVEESQTERVVLTRHGQPVALLTGISGMDLEALLLSQDEELRRLIAERRNSRKPLVSLATLKARAAAALAREGQTKRPKAARRPRRATKK